MKKAWFVRHFDEQSKTNKKNTQGITRFTEKKKENGQLGILMEE